MKSRLSLFSNILFAGAILLALYTLISTYITRWNVPPGVCPVTNNRPLIYGAIALSLVSFVVSFIEGRTKRHNEEN